MNPISTKAHKASTAKRLRELAMEIETGHRAIMFATMAEDGKAEIGLHFDLTGYACPSCGELEEFEACDFIREVAETLKSYIDPDAPTEPHLTN